MIWSIGQPISRISVALFLTKLIYILAMEAIEEAWEIYGTTSN